MDRSVKFALEAAKEITISKVQSSNMQPDRNSGECVASFYEAIFTKIKELSHGIDD